MAHHFLGFVALAWLLRIGCATTYLQLQRRQPKLRDGDDRKALLDGFSEAQHLDYSRLRTAFADVGVATNSDLPSANVSLQPGQSREPVPTRLEEYQQMSSRVRNNMDFFYTVPVQLGTPPVTVRMVISTGSSDMWVRSDLYDSRVSYTRRDEGYSAAVRYVKGSVFGTEVTDKICLGSFCVFDETFIAASSVRGIDGIDGVIGLAFPALASTRGKAFLTLLEEQRPYNHLAFGLSLHANGEDAENFIAIGELQDVIGDAPYRKNSAASWGVSLPVRFWDGQPRYWTVKATVKWETVWQRTEAFVSLDAGTSLLTVPAEEYLFVISSLLSQDQMRRCAFVDGQILCPCSVRSNRMTFSFLGDDGRTLEVALTAKDLLLPVGYTKIREGRFEVRTRVCILAVQAARRNVFILGDVFLRHVYSVYDVHEGRILLFASAPWDRAAAVAMAAPGSSPPNLDFGIGLLMPFAVVCAFILCTTLWALSHSCSPLRGQGQRHGTDYMQI